MIARRWIVNGVPCRLLVDPLMPLLHVLREVLGLTGAKEGCGEGECGACTILLDDRPVTACLVAAGQVLDESRILTIEGVAETPLGRAIVEAFAEQGAVQCGSCIPGMVVAAFALLRENPRPGEADVREALSGNLCRCTGYAKIVGAVRAAASRVAPDAAPPPTTREAPRPSRGPTPDGDPFFTATSIEDALAIRAKHPDCVLLAGGTDLIVGWNGDAGRPPMRVLSLEGIEELSRLREIEGGLAIGAMTRVERLAGDPRVARLAPALVQAARQLGARGIRERATVGGNLVNASPAADLLPPLVAAGATLVLASPAGRREVPIEAFYQGYQRADLAPAEILIEIRVPALPQGAREGFVKIGPRRAQAIAKVSVAARLTLGAGRIDAIAIAAGSVAPTVVRLARTEAVLRGTWVDEDVADRVAAAVASEVSPITDVRSTAEYRSAMTSRLLLDLLAQLTAESGDVSRTSPGR